MEYLTESGHWILVDVEDGIRFGPLSLRISADKIYVFTADNKPLHRAIMDAQVGQHVDHRNGNTLDNRKDNLRIVNNRLNSQNTVHRRNKTTASKYLGVTTSGSRISPWRSRFYLNKTLRSIGSFKSEHEAGLAYNATMAEHFNLEEMGGWNLLSVGHTDLT